MNLTEEQLRSRFESRIRPQVFRGAKPQTEPTTVLLGGQPGAGKSRAGEVAAAHAGDDLVPIVGDDFRQFHPDYRRAMNEDPLRMPDVTAQAAGRWIQMCVDHAREQGCSILIEGTWRNAQVPLEAARAATKDGRRVDAVVVAVQPEVSRLGAMERYYRDVMAGDDARWTPPAAHDAAVASLPGTVEAVAMNGDVDSLRVVTREGTTLFHSDERASPARVEGAVAALQEGMAGPLSPGELRRYEASMKAMQSAHERFTSGDPSARQAWTHITTHDLPLTRGRSARALAKGGQPGSTTGRPPAVGTGERTFRARMGPGVSPHERGRGRGE